MNDKKIPQPDGTGRWRVKEIYESPQSVLIEIVVANYITEGEAWPKVGQNLKVADDK